MGSAYTLETGSHMPHEFASCCVGHYAQLPIEAVEHIKTLTAFEMDFINYSSGTQCEGSIIATPAIDAVAKPNVTKFETVISIAAGQCVTTCHAQKSVISVPTNQEIVAVSADGIVIAAKPAEFIITSTGEAGPSKVNLSASSVPMKVSGNSELEKSATAALLVGCVAIGKHGTREFWPLAETILHQRQIEKFTPACQGEGFGLSQSRQSALAIPVASPFPL